MAKDMNGFYVGYTFKNMEHLSSDVRLCKVQGKSELLKKRRKKLCFLYCTKWYFLKVYAKNFFYTFMDKAISRCQSCIKN